MRIIDQDAQLQAPVVNMPHHSKMHVGFGLKMREALKRRFEVRQLPAAAAISDSTHAPMMEKSPFDDDDACSADDNPFKQLNKSSRPQETTTPMPVVATIGYRDECITVEARKNRKNQYVLVKGNDAFNTKDEPKKTRVADSVLDPYCLVLTRRYSITGDLESVILSIQSPFLVQVIRDIVDYYPDNAFRVGETITCSDPPEMIYHHRKELAQYKARSDLDKRSKLHIDFLLKFLYTHMAGSIGTYDAFFAAGMVKFPHLWMMFKPGTYVYERETDQVFRYLSGSFSSDKCGQSYFMMSCERMDYDGTALGKVNTTVSIRKFDHQREISALTTIPLDLHPEPEQLKQRLLKRGLRFLELRGIHVQQHATRGRVMVDAETGLKRLLPGEDNRALSKKRGMVITEKSECICPVCRNEVDETPEDYDHEIRKIPDDLLLLCPSTVLGFTLDSHRWTEMRIDDLSDVRWSSDAIDRLVLDKKQKKVISSLVNSPVFTEGVEGDVIGWKGKGLVMLMHGAPGTGKTLTAESICESLQRPLYIVSGGELGTSPAAIEKSLQEILDLSKIWKAVILIDEADVFLEERSPHDIIRNNFVSVFLRRLEYFEGILLLTSNRVESFDEAFISRIHLAIHYPELEPWMRKEIWRNALSRLPSEQLAIDINSELAEISKVPLNGRVISYAVRTAKAIADDDKSKVTLEHLWDVVSVQQKFTNHLRSKGGIASES